MNYLKKSIFFSCILLNSQFSAKKALVMVPVADVIGNPIATFNLAPTATQAPGRGYIAP